MTGPALAIMQPYFFPYVGYYSLVYAAEQFIFYDDVQWIKHGWINRNRILLNGKDFLFTVPVRGGSPNKLINEVDAMADERFCRKFMALIESAYKKAPHYPEASTLIESVLKSGHSKMADLAIHSIKSVFEYLGVSRAWAKSSVTSQDTIQFEKSERLISITKESGYHVYLNPPGGKTLYEKEYFKNRGVDLIFLEPVLLPYAQFDSSFVAGLSIIDALMFLKPVDVVKIISSYELV